MPVKPPNSTPHIANNGNYPSVGTLLNAAIVEVDNVTDIGQPKITPESIFLLNPESWTETKSTHWVQNAIPGQSDPILQWSSSGPRVVTFDALVTKDTSAQKEVLRDANPQAKSFFAGLASKVAGIPSVTVSSIDKRYVDPPFVLDISSRLNYYRSLLYPTYTDSAKVPLLKGSPPLVMLYVGGTFSNSSEIITHKKATSGSAESSSFTVSNTSTLWVVTNLRINITKQLPNLDPLEAVVNFELMQYTIAPFSRDNFISVS
jgi:hypothetical protein